MQNYLIAGLKLAPAVGVCLLEQSAVVADGEDLQPWYHESDTHQDSSKFRSNVGCKGQACEAFAPHVPDNVARMAAQHERVEPSAGALPGVIHVCLRGAQHEESTSHADTLWPSSHQALVDCLVWKQHCWQSLTT